MNFDIILHGVQQLCGANHNEVGLNGYAVPSLALKLGHSLHKCCAIIRGRLLRESNPTLNNYLQDFLLLMDLEFKSRISSTVLATLARKKASIEKLLPLTEDSLKLNNYLQVETQKLLNSINDYSSWRKLSELTLARIILFNKRRSGEAAKMLSLDYATRPQWDNCSRKLLGKYDFHEFNFTLKKGNE